MKNLKLKIKSVLPLRYENEETETNISFFTSKMD